MKVYGINVIFPIDHHSPTIQNIINVQYKDV